MLAKVEIFWGIAGALCWSVEYERDSCLLWRLLVPYQRMRTRMGVKEMSKVCKKCGWSLSNPEWGCIDCGWEEYNALEIKIGENE